MPNFYVNAAGERIAELEDIARNTRVVAFLSNLKWPRDRKMVMRMTPVQVKEWIYSLHPRQALILTSSRSWQRRWEKIQTKSWVQKLDDFVWRWFNGIPF